jgi:hypothetical protein
MEWRMNASVEPARAGRAAVDAVFVVLSLSIAACASAPRPAPAAEAAGDPVAQLEEELRTRPGDGAVMYALAMYNDRAGDTGRALDWLEQLAATSWDAGIDPTDFATCSLREHERFDAARAELERRWIRVPGAREQARVAERDLLPEGMEIDPTSGAILLSSGRKRKVVRVEPDGTTRDVVGPARDGLLATLGLRVDRARGVLWVASVAAPFMESASDTPAGVSRLHAFELATGSLRARFELEAPSLLNDVAVLPDGRAVVTDSAADALWITGDGRLEPFLPAGALSGPNGIAASADGAILYVATWRGIVVVDVAARRAEPLRLPPGTTNLSGIDGLYLADGALVGIQNAVGRPRVVRVPLGADRRSGVRVDVLESGSDVVDNPTTGSVVGGALVFLARRNRESAFAGGATRPAELDDIVLASVRLGNAP